MNPKSDVDIEATLEKFPPVAQRSTASATMVL